MPAPLPTAKPPRLLQHNPILTKVCSFKEEKSSTHISIRTLFSVADWLGRSPDKPKIKGSSPDVAQSLFLFYNFFFTFPVP